ncbi:hypothetical protein LHJ74_09510 [Streptomyces sp. N2-109]|uniref:DUF8094 domain-containing protein n=1 Tax=Streptomyces gossypii TaxID=2883101 RepID=A0ABT2JQP9_9ACTN|nr:hypothetical protein [Streptomyces gossypii]MCT2590146.1 hypothetical protein [Streptomyces gossypii]
MRARLLTATTLATVLATTLSGCLTVHGETAVVPAVGKSEAKKVLEKFAKTHNKSNKNQDAKLNATIEGGALGAIDQAGLKARREVDGAENKDFKPLELTDPRFLIPQQAGWPKSFVADTESNLSRGGRWLLVFQRNSVDADWKATYLGVVPDGDMPKFATDEDGYAEEVPDTSGSKLAVPPSKLSAEYVRYLQEGEGDFAPGPHTDAWRDQREKAAKQSGVRSEWADLAAKPPQFAPFGLRTEGGGALVFFASHHQKKQTVAKGYSPNVKDPYVKALMTGTPKQSITYVRVSGQAVTVPTAKEGGDVAFVSRITGLISARGE